MLSKKCQYALHALLYLAETDKEASVTISEIALTKRIPKKFLEVILLDLKNAGVLGSKKGKGGGYYLKRSADKIWIIEIIRIIDGAVAMLPCVSLNFYESCGMCTNEHECSINRLFGQVRDETLKILAGNSLSDLAKQPAILKNPVNDSIG
ncbi:RrF2 family transcriptional regulator [Ohtaekwangia koreensis]|uniref:Transcriptional regulator, BadM/Rrf2 family n=1 Tax=Ohtaekwangia koreensis TaxID=688867 RepID=A0A1T5IWL9_9BACT|nr:Rrf2 family transcriptional regulator [Ohtaekwangia koreensis]SKC43482.1 transcriptional regulator, BadM/Rrf2 family [Ohtaekwangia koreensis]